MDVLNVPLDMPIQSSMVSLNMINVFRFLNNTKNVGDSIPLLVDVFSVRRVLIWIRIMFVKWSTLPTANQDNSNSIIIWLWINCKMDSILLLILSDVINAMMDLLVFMCPCPLLFVSLLFIIFKMHSLLTPFILEIVLSIVWKEKIVSGVESVWRDSFCLEIRNLVLLKPIFKIVWNQMLKINAIFVRVDL